MTLQEMMKTHHCDLSDLCGKFISGEMTTNDRIEFCVLCVGLGLAASETKEWATIRANV